MRTDEFEKFVWNKFSRAGAPEGENIWMYFLHLILTAIICIRAMADIYDIRVKNRHIQKRPLRK